MNDALVPDQTAVLVEHIGHIMIVTINRPAVRNCVNLAVHIGIGEAIEDADRNPNVRVVILTGAGDKAFCAGADLKALARGEAILPDEEAKAAWGFAGYVQHHISKPTIAAVNGVAMGGGTELTLASDLAVAASTSTFGLSEVKRGIVAGSGGAFRIISQLPPKIGLELLLTGDPIGAARALEIGLVNAVVPPDYLMDTALALATKIARNAPLSVQASKRIARGIINGRIEAEAVCWDMTAREMALLMQSEDAQEGPRAFAEKRAPIWKGR